MTEAQLLDALIDATRKAPGGTGITVSEIVDATGVNEARVRKTIRAALAQGRVSVGTKNVLAISGRLCTVPSYAFVEPKAI